MLDAQASLTWALAGDYERWGLGGDAGVARKRTCELRIAALVCRTNAVTTSGGEPLTNHSSL